MQSAAFEIPSSVLFREVEGEMVLLELETEGYYGLDPVGARMITLVTARPYPEAIRLLKEEFAVDPDVLQRDLSALIDELIDAKLLRRIDGA